MLHLLLFGYYVIKPFPADNEVCVRNKGFSSTGTYNKESGFFMPHGPAIGIIPRSGRNFARGTWFRGSRNNLLSGARITSTHPRLYSRLYGRESGLSARTQRWGFLRGGQIGRSAGRNGSTPRSYCRAALVLSYRYNPRHWSGPALDGNAPRSRLQGRRYQPVSRSAGREGFRGSSSPDPGSIGILIKSVNSAIPTRGFREEAMSPRFNMERPAK